MKLYVSQYCPKCQLAETVLKQNNYDVQIVINPSEALSLGIMSAPALVCGEKIYNLKDILKIAKEGGTFE